MLERLLQNSSIRLWLPPIAGFLGYGAWAFYINYAYGLEVSIRSGLAQGSYSFVVTLVLTAMVEWLFVRLCAIPFGSIIIFLLVVLLLTTLSTSVNILVGTPNILWTILPSLIVSAVYTALHIFTLHKLRQRNLSL